LPQGRIEDLPKILGVPVGNKVAGKPPAQDGVGGNGPSCALPVLPLAPKEGKEKGVIVEAESLGFGKEGAKDPHRFFPLQEKLSFRNGFVGVTWGNHDPLHAKIGEKTKKPPEVLHVGAMEDGGVCGHPEPPAPCLLDSENSFPKCARFSRDGIVDFLRSVQVDYKAETLIPRELVEFFPKKEAIRAKVYPAALFDKAADNFGNFGVQEGLSSRDGDDRRPHLLCGGKGLAYRHSEVHDFLILPDSSAAGAAQIAGL